MPNKIIIGMPNADKIYGAADAKLFPLVSTLLEDVLIETSSKFTSLNEVVGSLLPVDLSLISTTIAGTSGGISEAWADITNAFTVPIWSSTEPARLTLRLGFFTKTNPKIDVQDPTRILCSQSILSKDPNNPQKFITPGVNLKGLGAISSGGKNKTNLNINTAKFISFWIPGIVYLPRAIIESSRPTFSRQMVKKGSLEGVGGGTLGEIYPLWSTVELNIVSLYPANDEMFTQANQGAFNR